MHADKTNRTMLVLLGLILLLGGVAALLTNLGVFTKPLAGRALFDNVVSRYIGDNGNWLWPLFAVLCAITALLCLRWIATLLTSTDRAGNMTLPGDKTAGRTVVRNSAFTTALVTELRTYRGVDTARARLVGDDDTPDLIVTVTAMGAVDIGALRARIESEALTHARQALDRPDLPIQLDLDVSRKTPDRTSQL